ncbi:MAG: hypothetical protein ILO68_03880, partial [Clostridia bacterium]|nr:hypothetical protein [Clostridia bacterium]
QTGDDSLDFSYRLFRLNPETGTWAGMETEAEPHPYDRNANNRTGLFRIEYDRNAKSGEPCSYVVLYRPVGTAEGSEEERILYYNDKAEEYPRIIRQSDAYAVLSLLRGESRDFIVLDTQGTAVYRLNGGADDVFESTPLTLFEDTLLLKTDTDDDYEYDTLTYRDLKEGSHAAVDFRGNFAYWTYSPDGSAVAAYNAEDGRTDMVVCDVAGGFRTSSFTLEGTVTDAVPLGGMVFVRMKDGTAFLADAATGTLSEPIQADGECLSVFSARSMAVLSEDGTASVYAAS